MAQLTKKAKLISEKIEHGKVYDFEGAVQVLKDLPAAKFLESVEVSVNLGIDPKKSDQVVRGATVLPNGTGKSVRVAVFTPPGEKADAAKQAGADVVGMDDLLKQMQDGDLDFDVVIASPDAMGTVGRLGQILGPRGLMPNPKVGTVTPDVAKAVKNAKSGQVRYRVDKNGILHFIIGKINFEIQALKENLSAVLADIKRLKPSTAKGQYIKSIFVATTMGPGLKVEAVKDRGGL